MHHCYLPASHQKRGGGRARRTIYARYVEKETLFKAALQRAVDQWIVPLAKLKAQETDDLEQTLAGIVRLWVANVRKKSGIRLVRVANTEVFRRPEIAQYLWDRSSWRFGGKMPDSEFDRQIVYRTRLLIKGALATPS